MKQEVLNGIFELLRTNKAFPNYHGERRIDIFINYFLTRILTNYLGIEAKFICPEFPLKKDGNNLSTKLDYLCTAGNQIIFCELKTDRASLKVGQADIYKACKWDDCLANLAEITKAVKNKAHQEKYRTLTEEIDKLNFSVATPLIRIIYLSPLPHDNSFFAKGVLIKNSKLLGDLDVKLNDDEIIVWKFIKSLQLSIFEILN